MGNARKLSVVARKSQVASCKTLVTSREPSARGTPSAASVRAAGVAAMKRHASPSLLMAVTSVGVFLQKHHRQFFTLNSIR